MSSKTASWSSFQSLVLRSGPSLSVQVLPQVVVGRLQLFDYVCCAAAPSLESHVSVSLVHVVDVILVLHGLPVVLILTYFFQDAFRASLHA